MMVPRYDIVPIPPRLRGNLAPGSIMEFPFEVVEGMYAFNANEVVGKNRAASAPAAAFGERFGDPTEQSVELFARRRKAHRPALDRRRRPFQCFPKATRSC